MDSRGDDQYKSNESSLHSQVDRQQTVSQSHLPIEVLCQPDTNTKKALEYWHFFLHLQLLLCAFYPPSFSLRSLIILLCWSFQLFHLRLHTQSTMIFLYLPLAAMPRLIKSPTHAAETSLKSKDLLSPRFHFHTRNSTDVTVRARDPIFGHSGAVVCGSILAALVGLAILGCLLVRRRTLCYKRRGMVVRCWKKLCRKKQRRH